MSNPPFLAAGRAACATPAFDPELWQSTDRDDERGAVAVCNACPLRIKCGEWALDQPEQYGTWGGLTARERHQVRSAGSGTWLDDQGRARRPCGSYAALMAHVGYDEECVTCRAAQDQRIEARRRAQLKREHAAGGTATGAEVHRRLGEPVCDLCRLAAARASKARRRARQAAHKPAHRPAGAAA